MKFTNALREAPTRTVSKWRTALALTLCLFGLAAQSQAAAILPDPSSIRPNDTYRIIFVTGSYYSGTFPTADMAALNQFVTDEANTDPVLAGLGTPWKVLGSTSSIDFYANTGLAPKDTQAFFFNTRGEFIAKGVRGSFGDGLFAGPSTNHLSVI